MFSLQVGPAPKRPLWPQLCPVVGLVNHHNAQAARNDTNVYSHYTWAAGAIRRRLLGKTELLQRAPIFWKAATSPEGSETLKILSGEDAQFLTVVWSTVGSVSTTE